MSLLLLLGLFLVVSGLAALVFARRWRRAAGLPGGRIIYTDPKLWGPSEKPLFSSALNLAGKPDYLVRQGDTVLPVEVKTGRTPSSPPDSHLYQLAAYCRLVEETYGQRPPYGILHYPRRTLAIDYTPELEASLEAVLEEIRSWQGKRSVPRSHDQPARCAGCGYRSACPERL